MATNAALLSRVRLELGDTATPFQTSALCDGVVNRFEIPHKPLATGLAVTYVSSLGVTTPLTEGVDFTVDYSDGILLFTTAPAAGTLIVGGSSYRYFVDADLQTFLDTALDQHFSGRADSFGGPITIATLPVVEEYPVAILAVIQALWALYTDSAFDIDISAPDGVMIPRHQRNQQLLEAISNRRAQYQELCDQLGVGLSRIEVFKVRRVSKQTGRYIPIYEEREVEDNRPSKRVFLPVNTYGGDADPEMAASVANLSAVANNSFTTTLTGLGDLTGLTVKAHIRPYKESISVLATPVTTVVDAVNGTVTFTLTAQQTYALRRVAWWDIQTQDASGNVATLREGEFLTERQGGF